MIRALLLGALAGAALSGCAQPARGPASLVDHAAWERLSDAADPWTDERPSDDIVRCGVLGVFDEEIGGEPSLTVDLTICNYVAVAQPAQVDVLAGDTVTLRLWRDEFAFASESPVHLAVRLGDAPAWDVTVPAPGDSGLELATWTADVDVLAGTSVRFLVNTHEDFGQPARHGANSLNFIELSRVDPGWELPE